MATAHRPDAADSVRTAHRTAPGPAKGDLAGPQRPGKASSPAPGQLQPGPPRPAPPGQPRTCTARTRPRPVSWPCRSCSRMLPGRGRPPQPPHAAAVAADRLPGLAPAPAAAGAAAMSPRPTNRKQAVPEPRRFLQGGVLRGGGGLSTSPPVDGRGGASRVAGAVRAPRPCGNCSLG